MEYLLWALCYAEPHHCWDAQSQCTELYRQNIFILFLHRSVLFLLPLFTQHWLKTPRILHFQGQGSAPTKNFYGFLFWLREQSEKGRPKHDHSCQRTWETKGFFQEFYIGPGWCLEPPNLLFAVSWALLCLPVAVQGEGCSQGIVHGRSGVQVGCREQPQQQHTDSSLPCPVQRCSLGTACKEKHSQGKNLSAKGCEIWSVCKSKTQPWATLGNTTGASAQAGNIKTDSVKLPMQHPQNAQLTGIIHPPKPKCKCFP